MVPEPMESLRQLSKAEKVALAAYRRTPVAARVELAQDPDVEVRKAFAASGWGPSGTLLRLSSPKEDDRVAMAVAKNDMLPAKAATNLLARGDLYINRALAGNRGTPGKVLDELMKSRDAVTRTLAAGNSRTSGKALDLERLNDHPSEAVRRAIARNGRALRSTLLWVFETSNDVEALRQVLNSSKLTKDDLVGLTELRPLLWANHGVHLWGNLARRLEMKDGTYSSILAKKMECFFTSVMFLALLEEKGKHKGKAADEDDDDDYDKFPFDADFSRPDVVAIHMNSSDLARRSLFWMIYYFPIGADASPLLRFMQFATVAEDLPLIVVLASRPNIPAVVRLRGARMILDSGQAECRKDLARAKGLPRSVYRRLAADQEVDVRRTLAWIHVEENPWLADLLILDPDPSVREHLAENPCLPRRLIPVLEMDPSADVRKALLKIQWRTRGGGLELVKRVSARPEDRRAMTLGALLDWDDASAKVLALAADGAHFKLALEIINHPKTGVATLVYLAKKGRSKKVRKEARLAIARRNPDHELLVKERLKQSTARVRSRRARAKPAIATGGNTAIA